MVRLAISQQVRSDDLVGSGKNIYLLAEVGQTGAQGSVKQKDRRPRSLDQAVKASVFCWNAPGFGLPRLHRGLPSGSLRTLGVGKRQNGHLYSKTGVFLRALGRYAPQRSSGSRLARRSIIMSVKDCSWGRSNLPSMTGKEKGSPIVTVIFPVG